MALIEKLSAIGNAIREKTGKEELLTLEQMPEEIAGISGGGEMDYIGNLQYAFQDTDFGGIDFVISVGAKTGAIHSSAFDSAFRGATGLKSLTINCGFKAVSNVSFANFLRGNGGDETLKTLDLSGLFNVIKPTSLLRWLDYKSGLIAILGEIDMSACTNTSSAFQSASSLETIRIKKGTLNVSINFAVSSSLTDASVQSIIDGLADLTGGTAQTLTLHSAVKGKLTDSQIAAITNKNWNLA